MSKNLISASIIAAALLVWLGSGFIWTDSAPDDHLALAAQQPVAAQSGSPELTRVRVEAIQSEPRRGFLVLRGRTESKRMVEVKAEIAGKVLRRPVERGARVEKGELLCEIAVDDRAAAVAEAKAALDEAKIEYEGSLKLKEQGLQSETAIAKAASRLESARAQLRRQDLNLERTRVVAPFGGVVEELHMNTGDYATPGAVCATLIDLDPMLVRADVTESEVESMQLGDRVFGSTSVGRNIEGIVTFAGKQSDPVTRTYPVEITVENSDYSIRSGLTVSVRIGLNEVQAHRLSPALMTLGDEGEIGVRTVDASNRVIFYSIRIVEDGPEGVWVTGLPESTLLITVGQEFVSAGELVEAIYTNVSDAEAPQS